MKQAIGGYHQDEELHWVAELACGHFQHVRHDPPWVQRPWVVSEAGRQQMLGHLLECKNVTRARLQTASICLTALFSACGLCSHMPCGRRSPIRESSATDLNKRTKASGFSSLNLRATGLCAHGLAVW